MLIDKPFALNDVVTLKLVTGEEVVGTLLEESDSAVTIGKPCTIAQTQQGMGMMPWIITSQSKKAELGRHAIIAIALSDEDIAKSYTENTSDIQIV